ncbi:MAG: hypothetical protein LDL47_04695 [Cyanobacteria bacterium KgW148]|nr:hypothetical protein [Cyanobacteria bacterium KgW148]
MDNKELISLYKTPIQRLIDLQTVLRWLFSLTMWLTLGSFSLWQIRQEIALILDIFTWSAVRSVIQYRALPSLGVMFCLSTTLATLVWQSQHILMGFSLQEQLDMVRYIQTIEAKGPKHPLWRWIFPDS